MYPGLSHDEIIEERLKELKHHFEVGPEVALISAGLTKSLTFRIRIFRFATSQSRFSPQAEEKS